MEETITLAADSITIQASPKEIQRVTQRVREQRAAQAAQAAELGQAVKALAKTLAPDKIGNRHERRAREAFIRTHAFQVVGRKTRNLCQRKYVA